jgi:meso-butanediol dehydrogenase/(S,S)-butanediol dehydrogenase/diacetyl reductase
MAGRLEGRRVLVTGGASGIGAGIVERFRAEGATVTTMDLAQGDITADLRSTDDCVRAVAEAADRMGGLDTLVLNAARPCVGTLWDIDDATWDDAVAINLTSVQRLVRAAWSHLAATRGCVLLTGSVVGLDGSANQAAYCATKAGVVMLTKCIAIDGAPHGVLANCVCPGFTETPMLETFLAEQDDPDAVRAFATGLHPLGRLGTPRDIAEAFVYLASDEASWVTGVALPVDGGLLAGI